MIPRSIRLIRALRRLISDVQQTQLTPASREKLAMADAMLNDFSLGEETGFYQEYLEQGRSLIREGVRLMQEQGCNAGDAHSMRAREAVNQDINGSSVDTAKRSLRQISSVLIEQIEYLFQQPFVNAAPWLHAFYARVSDWERALYARRCEYETAVPVSFSRELRADTLQTYLRRKFTARSELEVVNCRQLSGGYSRSTWLIDVQNPREGPESFVIRGEQPISSTPVSGFDITTEFGVLQLANQAGLPVPEPLWLETDASQLGMRFIASRKATGINFGSFDGADRNLSPALLRNLVSGLVAIHNVDLKRYPAQLARSHLKDWMSLTTITDAIIFWLKNWHSSWKNELPDSPILARAFTWLVANVPRCDEAPVLLHSDYALSNILFDKDKVSAVLDWEVTHIGDPAEEVSWLMSNLGKSVERDTISRLYAEAGGRSIDDYRLRYFDVFASVKYMVCGVVALRRFDQFDEANPNLHWLARVLTTLPASNSMERLIALAEAAKPC